MSIQLYCFLDANKHCSYVAWGMPMCHNINYIAWCHDIYLTRKHIHHVNLIWNMPTCHDNHSVYLWSLWQDNRIHCFTRSELTDQWGEKKQHVGLCHFLRPVNTLGNKMLQNGLKSIHDCLGSLK